MHISRAIVGGVVVLGLLGVGGCATTAAPGVALTEPAPGVPGVTASGLTGPVYPGTDEGARALMRRLGAAGDQALMQALQPAGDDYAALFQPSFATRARGYYTRMWTTMPSEDHPLASPEQTQLSLAKGATEQVRAWTPQVKEVFPGGYKKVKDQLRPGLTIYVWRYVAPGEQAGVVCNGLVFVNGHWAYFPSPWKVP